MSTVLKMKSDEGQYVLQEEAEAIGALVSRAADVAAPVWPLKTFIACNPLQGYECLPFEEALAKADGYKTINRYDIAGRGAVNREMIKWLGAFLDEGQATLHMPHRSAGFYRAFVDLARYDSKLRRSKEITSWLARLPLAPEEAIAAALKRLKIAGRHHEEFIRQSLAALPGWSGYVKWNTDWRNDRNAPHPITLKDYVAVRLIITCALWPEARVLDAGSTDTPARSGPSEAEEAYGNGLLKKLLPQVSEAASPGKDRPQAQLAFCIDVRSEPFRRSVEAQGTYETLGFAGFFGLPVRVKGYDDEEAHDSCPVLLTPSHEVHDHPARQGREVTRHHHRRSILQLPGSIYQSLKYNFATPFVLVEMLGPWYGVRMLARTFVPSRVAMLKACGRGSIMPALLTQPSLDGIPLAQQAEYAEKALRMMGLTQRFAPLVVLCGHGSTTNNNAYASALDCGACGGNHGGANARIMAAILNRQDIRSILAERGLAIPEDTLFVAAQHDTTTDQVELYHPACADKPHQAAIARLRQDLTKAGAVTAALRCATFGLRHEKRTVKQTLRRSRDWAQPRPEWGLARNASFIIGPRALSRDVDLEGRSFLHSYDWENDPDGTFLTAILTAPMVVAQWINSQYLFSTLDNVCYGGGSKVTKNVTGKLGIMQGNASDLMHGLPLQSVYAADDKPYHEPLRLLTVVYAPRGVIEAIVHKQAVLQKLFGNGWVRLACIDPSENKAYLLQRDFTWRKTH